MKSINYIMSG